MRIEWAYTFNELRDQRCNFLFIDESGFNVSLGRGRGYARVGESPSVIVPPKGPNVTLIALMGLEVGLLYEKYVGGISAKTFDQFLRAKAPIIKKAYPKDPVVIILDNARIHKSSKAEGVDIPKTIQELGFFHLFTIPYSPQLNAIEMVFSQLKSFVISEFSRNPERRKDLSGTIDGAMRSVTSENIENYYRHQAKVVTQCLRGIQLSPDDLIYREVDDEAEEEQSELHRQNMSSILEEVRRQQK